MSKKHILFLSANDFKEKSIQVLRKTPEAFVNAGWKVTYIVARDYSTAGNYYYEKEINIEGVDIIRFPFPFTALRNKVKNHLLQTIITQLAGYLTILKLYSFAKKELKKNKVDFVSICSPNYLHDAHIRLALRNDADAICEKPLLLNPWNIEGLLEIEKESGRKIHNILQLRHHPVIVDLKAKISSLPKGKKHNIKLSYITSRGKWYHYSWKGNISKSGGIVTNIGIHFFDMLSWIFGKAQDSHLHLKQPDKASGLLELENANVSWYLSLDSNDLPAGAVENEFSTFRSITIDDEEIEFSGGFTNLHTLSYQKILAGNSFGIEDSRQSIEIAHTIRNQTVSKDRFDLHPFVKK